jgi:hypothetical protein
MHRAALLDVSLGTHMHGLFCIADPDDKTFPPASANNRRLPVWEFRRFFRLEDDFLFHAKQAQLWKIESVDLAAVKVTALLAEADKPVGKSLGDFYLGPGDARTRGHWQGEGGTGRRRWRVRRRGLGNSGILRLENCRKACRLDA